MRRPWLLHCVTASRHERIDLKPTSTSRLSQHVLLDDLASRLSQMDYTMLAREPSRSSPHNAEVHASDALAAG